MGSMLLKFLLRLYVRNGVLKQQVKKKLYCNIAQNFLDLNIIYANLRITRLFTRIFKNPHISGSTMMTFKNE